MKVDFVERRKRMSGINLYYCAEGVSALREFAQAIPVAVQNIEQSTEKLMNVYNSVSEDVGVHGGQFLEILEYVKSAQRSAADAVQELPIKLESTASSIESYISSNVSGN